MQPNRAAQLVERPGLLIAGAALALSVPLAIAMLLDLHKVAAPAAVEITLAVISAVGLGIAGTASQIYTGSTALRFKLRRGLLGSLWLTLIAGQTLALGSYLASVALGVPLAVLIGREGVLVLTVGAVALAELGAVAALASQDVRTESTAAAVIETETLIGLGLKAAQLEQRLGVEAAARSRLERELAGEREHCAQFQQRLGAAEAAAQPHRVKRNAPPQARVGRNDAPSLRQRIERVLIEAGGGPVHSADLREALPDVSPAVLRAGLSKLAAAGVVSSVPAGGGRSAWQLGGEMSRSSAPHATFSRRPLGGRG